MKLAAAGRLKKKGVALTSTSKPVEEEEDLVNFLAKNFQKSMKKFGRKPSNPTERDRREDRHADNGQFGRDRGSIRRSEGGSNDRPRNYERRDDHGKFSGITEKSSRAKLNKDIRCFECEGYGHVRSECPVWLNQKRSRGYVATHSDEEYDDDEDRDDVVAFMGAISTNTTGLPTAPLTEELTDDEEDMSEEELFANYSELFEKWTQLTEQSKQLKMSNLTMTQEKE